MLNSNNFYDRNGKKWSIDNGDWKSHKHQDVLENKRKLRRRILKIISIGITIIGLFTTAIMVIT